MRHSRPRSISCHTGDSSINPKVVQELIVKFCLQRHAALSGSGTLQCLCRHWRQEPGASPMGTQLSLLVTQQGVELLIQICQEFIDLPVFTVSLQIEACELECNPREHIF